MTPSSVSVMTSPCEVRRSKRMAAKSPRIRLPGVLIQKLMVPVLELSAGIAGTVIRLGFGAVKSITPLRPSSSALQVAAKLVPGWVADGLLSTMTLLTGAASKLNRIRSDASITSAPKAGSRLKTLETKPMRNKGVLFMKGGVFIKYVLRASIQNIG